MIFELGVSELNMTCIKYLMQFQFVKSKITFHSRTEMRLRVGTLFLFQFSMLSFMSLQTLISQEYNLNTNHPLIL